MSEHGRTKELDVVVNMTRKRVPDQTVTFDEIVRLAFPQKVGDANTTFTVNYRKAKEPQHAGAMVEGDSVVIKENGDTSFTVVHATKS